MTYTHARNHLAETMQAVVEDRDAVITDYLLRSPGNARRLMESIEQDRAGEVVIAEIPDSE